MACCCFEQLYEVVAVSSETGIPGVGDTYPLDSVYCRDVVKTGVTVAITEIDGLQGMSLHPLYNSIPCESYISSPIHVEGKVWGTLNFTSLEKRDMPFSEAEIKFNEENASLIARALNEDVARTEPVVS
jgi:GAF domain-containing protein